jgi:predicted ATPase
VAIQHVRVSNFKSFRELDVTLGRFDVLIGANAAGKSSFTQIFQFLVDISRYGIRDAVSLQGGPEFLRNVRLGRSEPLSVMIESKAYASEGNPLEAFRYFRLGKTSERSLIGLRSSGFKYELWLEFKGAKSFKVTQERITLTLDVSEGPTRTKQLRSRSLGADTKIGEATLTVSNEKGRPKFKLESAPDLPLHEEELFPYFVRKAKLPPGVLLLQSPVTLTPFLSRRGTLLDVGIYDFDPKLPKRAVPITGRTELEADGSNLTLVLRSIIEHREKRQTFSRLIKDLLPFVERLDVQRFADKSLLFKLREKYAPRVYLPASVVSDGTINITALIVVLCFVERGFLVIEEPERNIHPSLIAKVAEMLQDASQARRHPARTQRPQLQRIG